ncbi:Atu4866 domain-containing protein [Streptomyces endophyticus]|uniref:Atu4866 domain-containing protein n=1 Tax=Streptomyces endophyticus TaxID=714166 RepID=A0ABU6F250_9ACTN|nr:Atu4866 domain-containing protein [Streptomyces endophyticus]MEB8338090.1 Atu4866 domain-containing protein [Streptomyces endophyticus]
MVNTHGDAHPYLGMWITADGQVRHQLLPGGPYDEARGSVESACTGSCQITGDRIFYQDDSAFSADGIFIDGVLHHAGMAMHCAGAAPSTAGAV